LTIQQGNKPKLKKTQKNQNKDLKMRNLKHTTSFEFIALDGSVSFCHIDTQDDGFTSFECYSQEPSFWADLDVECYEEVECASDADFFSMAMQCYVVAL
jgi:hypothetical protein